MTDEAFLSRWLRRKSEARAGRDEPGETAGDAGPRSPAATASAEPVLPRTPGPDMPLEPAADPLPPIESLTPDSDITAFMKPQVDPLLRRAAVKAILQDPRFDVMDGLDVYIDDYSIPDPLPPEWLGELRQMARLGDYRAREEAEEAERQHEAEVEIPSDDGREHRVKAADDDSGEGRGSDTPAAGNPPPDVPQS